MAKIMVADDRPMNRQYLVTLLGYFGHELLEASDGVEALKIAQAQHPDLVISDLIMPTMDGQALALQLRGDPRLANVPMIFYSATYSVAQAESVARSVGAFGVLPKPSDPEVIIATVNRALGQTPSSASPPPPDVVQGRQVPVVVEGLPEEIRALEAISYRLAAVIEMSFELAAERDPQRLLRGLGQMARKLIAAKYAVVSMLDKDDELVRHFFSGERKEVSGFLDPGRLIPPDGLAGESTVSASRLCTSPLLGRLAMESRTLRLRNVNAEQFGEGFPLPPLGHSKVESLLCVPIQSPSRLRGWLSLVDKLGAEAFSEEDGRVAATLASQAAVAYEKVEERRQAEDALRVSEERRRLMVEGVKDYAIFMLDRKGCVVTWNTGAERIKGYQAQEIMGKHFSVFYPPEETGQGKPEQMLKEAEAKGRCEDEGWRVRKDGSRFWADVIITALRDEHGRLVGFSKITRDLTERKQAEEQIRQLNQELKQRIDDLGTANQSLEAFSYSVSHDLRAPLRAIGGFAGILVQDYANHLDEEGHRLLNTITANTQKMNRLVEDLLSFCRLSRQELTKSQVDMTKLAQRAVEELRESETGRQIEVNIQPLPQAMGDVAMLRQVFANLVSNAFKFTRVKAQARVDIGARLSGREMIYYVHDDGAGFDMQYAQKLFGVFQRLHRANEFEGTGIGLAVVQNIIQRHGGRVWAEGRVGEGATFYFTL